MYYNSIQTTNKAIACCNPQHNLRNIHNLPLPTYTSCATLLQAQKNHQHCSKHPVLSEPEREDAATANATNPSVKTMLDAGPAGMQHLKSQQLSTSRCDNRQLCYQTHTNRTFAQKEDPTGKAHNDKVTNTK